MHPSQTVISHPAVLDSMMLQGIVRVSVDASVTRPEKLHRYVTNTFNFEFRVDLKLDLNGDPIPPKRILPETGKHPVQNKMYKGRVA